ncbi:MAG TPA: bifunctional phosphopantothenoylcysteine decarboxylase/phosphopantothenate--cysteine ligase CoaBC, partial [Candidatus Wirthbacteria bacterium]|nr:bifunctional phosphopantothenoylcysteine decarboxylase/phosphopantothenate--cysteine ligase CoaBC [Candidatus Wirthbacteria bacterium]
QKVLVAPAMNQRMYAHPLTQESLKKLASLGVQIVEPVSGDLACGEQGLGKLAPLEAIVEACHKLLSEGLLTGRKILITAGPTQEPLDPVRYLSNHSSGQMGYNLAKVASRLGAQVTLISGSVEQTCPTGIKLIRVTTAQQMFEQVKKQFKSVDALIAAAAVADFRPCKQANKIKKDQAKLNLDLEINPDILAWCSLNKQKQILIGFALETKNLIPSALDKLKSKNLDLIIANPSTALNQSHSAVSIINCTGQIEKLPDQPKETSAYQILERLAALF